MDEHLEHGLRELIDRSQIEQCLLRYTRGVDRMDADMIRSAFHDDAVDHHAQPHQGSIDEFMGWWWPLQSAREATQHYIVNCTIDLDGDEAHAETYFLAFIKLHDDPDGRISGGRYCDRFERRASAWRIARRVVLSEWNLRADSSAMANLSERAMGLGSRDRHDPSYERPLRDPRADHGS